VATRPALDLPPGPEVPPGLIDLASGNPDLDLLPPLGPGLVAIASHHEPYGAPAVDADLAEVFRSELSADGVAADQLAIVSGALDGMERVLGAHLRPGDRVALEDPGYPAVAELVAAMGFGVVPVAVDDRGPVPASMAEALERGVEAVVVTPRAQNPTGAALDHDRAAELADRLDTRPGVLVIEDDHAGPVAGQPFRHLCAGRVRWATVRSVAKSLGPDLRLAALVGDEVTIGRVVGRQSLGAGWVSHVLQRLVLHLLTSPETRVGLERASAAYTDRRRAVVEVLSAAGQRVHGRSGLNVWIPVHDEAAVVAGMERLGFAIRSGAPFRRRSPAGVRVSTAANDVDTLTEAARALVELVQSRPGLRSG
jgi:DNA-binding transcriptional MocR family regulator